MYPCFVIHNVPILVLPSHDKSQRPHFRPKLSHNIPMCTAMNINLVLSNIIIHAYLLAFVLSQATTGY